MRLLKIYQEIDHHELFDKSANAVTASSTPSAIDVANALFASSAATVEHHHSPIREAPLSPLNEHSTETGGLHDNATTFSWTRDLPANDSVARGATGARRKRSSETIDFHTFDPQLDHRGKPTNPVIKRCGRKI